MCFTLMFKLRVKHVEIISILRRITLVILSLKVGLFELYQQIIHFLWKKSAVPYNDFLAM